MSKVTAHNDVLGTLTFNPDSDAWEGEVRDVASSIVTIRLSTSYGSRPKLSTEELFDQGVSFLRWARDSADALKEAIAVALLDTYNQSWASKKKPPGRLSRDEFVGRLSLKSLVLDVYDPSFVYFTANGLFRGHLVEVRLEPGCEISEVALAG